MAPWAAPKSNLRFFTREHCEPHMDLHFSPVDTPLPELEVWHANSGEYSFAISRESWTGPGLHGKPGFVASWRPLHHNKPATKVGGSPFKSLFEAQAACEVTLEGLTAVAPPADW